jgi:ParB family transcriptional regulator, chromosome partitioning protein
VTKDRRLGRGLAALLGTPTDEQGGEFGGGEFSTPRPATREPSSSPNPSGPGGGPGAAPERPKLRVHREDELDELAEEVAGGLAQPVQDQGPRADREDQGEGLLELNVHEIADNPFQPRREFLEEEIASLAESLKSHQMLQPVLVRKVAGRYQLISGERRLRAAIQAGWSTVPARVREADDRLVAELAIVENLQRKDLNAVEKAMSFKRYLDEHGCTQEDLARRLKIDRSTIANLIRLLELPEEVIAQLSAETLSAGHARALLPLGDEELQREFCERIAGEGWSVRETERQVQERIAAEDGPSTVSGSPRAKKKSKSDQVAALEQELRMAVGTKVEIRQTSRGRGRIVIHFADHDEFDRLWAYMTGEDEPEQARSA